MPDNDKVLQNYNAADNVDIDPTDAAVILVQNNICSSPDMKSEAALIAIEQSSLSFFAKRSLKLLVAEQWAAILKATVEAKEQREVEREEHVTKALGLIHEGEITKITKDLGIFKRKLESEKRSAVQGVDMNILDSYLATIDGLFDKLSLVDSQLKEARSDVRKRQAEQKWKMIDLQIKRLVTEHSDYENSLMKRSLS